MYNRSLAVDENFLKFVKEGRFPQSDIRLTPQDVGLSNVHLIDLFETQLISRLLDLEARALKEKNQSFYTIGSSGHEGNAAVALAFDLKDLAFLHYRDAAFFIQRAKQLAGSTPIYDMLLSFVASSEDPISGGRHKVLGSVNLNIPPQTSTIASHLPKAVGAAIGIDLRRRLNHNLKNKDVVICSFGDASLNHSTAQGAINTAQWIAYRKLNVPIVFVCEDNGLGISVKTPPDWVGRSIKDRPMIKYIYGDGLHILDAYRASLEAALI
ncbi:MAG: MFS transporter, partial [Calditrichaeota bacterium]|nr:MFS transporter [Calditrichota bacterium]